MHVNGDRDALISYIEKLESEALENRSLRLQLDRELGLARAVAETTARNLQRVREELELTRETLTQVRIDLRAAKRSLHE
jgi:hypothetical protein